MDGSTPTLYAFRDVSGYLIHPQKTTADAPIALGHTASVSPWQDADVHLHQDAVEIFILRQGRLHFIVADSALDLQADELLLVRRGVPHAIVGGEGLIEHFGLRAPATHDRQSIDPRPAQLPPLSSQNPRELYREWGYRLPLWDKRNQNRWLLGPHGARVACDHLALTYVRYNSIAATGEVDVRETLHVHQRTWEYYLVLEGSLALSSEQDLLTVERDQLLAVPPGFWHGVNLRREPFAGFTIRAPLAANAGG